MKRVIFCFVALCCTMLFIGCETNHDVEFENNLIRLSDEHTSSRFHNGDNINFYYHCEFATKVDFAIKAEDDTTILMQKVANLKPGEGYITFKIDTDGYEGKAFIYLTYNGIKRANKKQSNDVSTAIWEITITNEGSWYYQTEAINELLESCKNFDAEMLIAAIAGKWMPDSLLIYDDEWAKITTPLRVMGEDYVDGRAYSYYTFAADGTGYRYVDYPEPDMEPETLEFSWTYNAESGKLTLSGDYNNEWSVTGYSNNYIVLDQISREGWNYRTILKRQAEGVVPTVISYMEYTLSGTQCEWQLPLLNNNVIIVDSDEDLTKYITSENGDSYPHIDFTKYTMIIANGGTPQGISDVIIDSFQQITEAEYNLNIRVLMTMTDAPELWVKALLVDKWDRPSTVNLNVEIIGQ